MKDGKNRGLSGVTLLIFILFLFGILWFTNQFDQREREITWEEFEELVDSNDVESYTIRQNKNVPTGRVELQLEEEDGEEGEIKSLYVSDVNEIQDFLKGKQIDFELIDVPRDSWFATTIMPMLLMLAGILIIFYFMNRQGGGANTKAMNFGKSRARMSTDSDKKVTFAQVAGLQEEKEELEEIVDFLKAPKKYIQVGARIPKALRVPVRRCWPKRWQVKPAFRFSRSPVRISWKCLWAWALPVCGTCLRMRRNMRRVLFSSMRLTRWHGGEAPGWAAATMSGSRP